MFFPHFYPAIIKTQYLPLALSIKNTEKKQSQNTFPCNWCVFSATSSLFKMIQVRTASLAYTKYRAISLNIPHCCFFLSRDQLAQAFFSHTLSPSSIQFPSLIHIKMKTIANGLLRPSFSQECVCKAYSYHWCNYGKFLCGGYMKHLLH